MKIRLVALLLLVFGLGAAPALAQKTTKEDERIIAQLNTDLRELQVKAQSASDDLVRYTQYQEEILELVRTALAKVSPKTRPALQVTLTIMGPLQEESNAYLKQAAAKIQGGVFELADLREREQIAPRIRELQDLRNRNERLRARINRIDEDMRKVLAESTLSAAEQRGFMEGFNRGFGRRVGPMKAVRTLETALYDQFLLAVEHLDRHWGAWKPTEDGPFEWTDPAAQEAFEKIVAEIQELARRQSEAERIFAERLQGN
jgi:hypothetical protein